MKSFLFITSKKILIILFSMLIGIPTLAQYMGDGYYRILNMKSERFISFIDNKSEGFNVSTATCDADALVSIKKFNNVVSDAGSVVYVEKYEDNKYNLKAQGADTYSLFGQYLTLTPKEANTYWASVSESGITLFLFDVTGNETEGRITTQKEGSEFLRRWYILPISATDDSNYFGLTAEVNAGGKMYTSFFGSFPYTLASSGMKAYAVTKVDGDIAVMTEVQGKVASKTPVIIVCAGSEASDNRLNIEMQDTSAPDGNLLNGLYFENSQIGFINDNEEALHFNATKYDPNTMRLLGTTSSGKLGFIKANVKYVPKNRAYLNVTPDSPDEITLLTQAEYNEIASGEDQGQDDELDRTFVFVDEQGNVVPDGTVITVNSINAEGQMVIPLKVKNVEGNAAAVSMYENIDGIPNGGWQTCAFGNCMTLSATGYSAKNIISGTDACDIQTEWIPEQGNYASWTATLQIHLFNTITKTVFGMEQQVAGEEIIGYGPKVTINFVYDDNVVLPEKCATPTIAFTNGKLQFTCETEGVEFVPSISLIDTKMESNDKIDLFSVYRFNVYAKKEGYADSDVATMDIDFNRLNGDMNHDGQISIADATAIVNIILNDITVIDPEQKFYYSVGTEKVTRTNYTTVNNAQYKLEFSEIPEELDLSVISQQQAIILLPEGCIPIIKKGQNIVTTTSVSLGNGYSVYTTTTTINGAECTCTILK